MARWCWYLLMFGWLAIQTQAVAQQTWFSKLGSVVRHKAVVVSVSAAIVFGGSVLAAPELGFEAGTQLGQEGEVENSLKDEEIEQAWGGVWPKSTQYASVFYLLIDLPSHWRVMHIEYVGNFTKGGRIGKPLFVGTRYYVLKRRDEDGKDKFVFEDAVVSLVGHDGLVIENAEVEEVTYFSYPDSPYYDQTLLTIKDFDYEDYEPIRLADVPKPDTELKMLSYRVNDANLLHHFGYPLEQRKCRTVGFDAEKTKVVHNCHIPYTPAVNGSPIFDKQAGTMIAFYLWPASDGNAFGKPVLPELQEYIRKALAVESQGKLATTWGALKH